MIQIEILRTFTNENIPTYSVKTDDGQIYSCKRWSGNGKGHWESGQWIVDKPYEWFIVLPDEISKQIGHRYISETRITEDTYKLTR